MKLQFKESILLFSFIFVFIFSTSSSNAAAPPPIDLTSLDYYCDNQDDICGCSINTNCPRVDNPATGSITASYCPTSHPDYGFKVVDKYPNYCIYIDVTGKCGAYGTWGQRSYGIYDCVPKTGYDEECLTFRLRYFGVESGCWLVGTCKQEQATTSPFREYNSVHSIDTQCGTATNGIDAVKDGTCGIPLTPDEGKCIPAKEPVCQEDGTPQGKCSTSKGQPYYCDPSTVTLIPKCSGAGGDATKCGCPSGTTCDPATGRCGKCGDLITQPGEECEGSESVTSCVGTFKVTKTCVNCKWQETTKECVRGAGGCGAPAACPSEMPVFDEKTCSCVFQCPSGQVACPNYASCEFGICCRNPPLLCTKETQEKDCPTPSPHCDGGAWISYTSSYYQCNQCRCDETSAAAYRTCDKKRCNANATSQSDCTPLKLSFDPGSCSCIPCNKQTCELTSLSCPAKVEAGKPFQITYTFDGAVGSTPYEIRVVSSKFGIESCKTDDKTGCTPTQEGAIVVAPQQLGSYTYGVGCAAKASQTGQCSAVEAAQSCTVQVVDSVGPNVKVYSPACAK